MTAFEHEDEEPDPADAYDPNMAYCADCGAEEAVRCSCGRLLCDDCSFVRDGERYCPDCDEKQEDPTNGDVGQKG